MKRKSIWVVLSVLVVLGLLTGIFGCAKQAPTTTAPAPTAPASPKPSPAPSPSVVPVPVPSPKPVSPTTAPATTAPAPAQQQPIKWTMQATYSWIKPPPERFSKFGYYGSGSRGFYIADALERATGGRLKVEVVPSGSVVPATEIFDAVKAGTIDAAWHGYAAQWIGVIPEVYVELGLTYTWQKQSEYWDAMVNFGMQQIIQEAYAEHGLWVVDTPDNDHYTWFTNFEPTSPYTFKGKKFRAWGHFANWLQEFGGVPVAIPGPETYMAMKLGTVDAVLYTAMEGNVIKLNEVTKYVVADPPTTAPPGCSFVTNQKSIDKLPADIKAIFKEVLPYAAWQFSTQNEAAEDYTFRRLTALGLAGNTSEGYIPVYWSEKDKEAAYAASQKSWDSIAAKGPRVKKLVDLVKQQMKEYGRLK